MGSSSDLSLSVHTDIALLTEQCGLLGTAYIVSPAPNSQPCVTFPHPIRKKDLSLSPYLVQWWGGEVRHSWISQPGVESKLSFPRWLVSQTRHKMEWVRATQTSCLLLCPSLCGAATVCHVAMRWVLYPTQTDSPDFSGLLRVAR